MASHYVYRTYRSNSGADRTRQRLSEILMRYGFVSNGESEGVTHFRYPSLRFSSARPLTCISRLSFEFVEQNGSTLVKTGVTFTKIKYFTICIMLMICAVIPAVLGIVQRGVPDIPPMSYLGIPLGFMVHYHVRGRVFRALGRLVRSVE